MSKTSNGKPISVITKKINSSVDTNTARIKPSTQTGTGKKK